MNIGTLKIGPGEPCALIAELSNSHNQSLDRAYRMMDAAQEAGASAIKIQTYTAQEIVDLRGDGPAPPPWDGLRMFDLYTRAATPLEWVPLLFRRAETMSIPLFSSVFGPESLAVLESVGNPCYKIARLDNTHEWLVNAVAVTGKPFLVSGSGRDGYRLRAGARRVSGEQQLFCPPGYPPNVEDIELPQFEDPDGYVYWLGLSSHCLHPDLPIAAVARGAKLLEYHFQLDDEPSELEASVSLSATQFRTMVDRVRQVETMLA